MIVELKPCPFCGGEARLRTGVTSGLSTRPIAWVKCKSCEISTPALIDSHTDGVNISEVIDMWNKRVDKEVDE